MPLIILLFVCAFALSGAAAFYSIAGLMAIFAAAPIPIAIMGTTLEASKLVIASWLYRNWKPIPKLMRGYLTASLVVLMMLTSMGIFGFLSKAHLDQGVPTGDVAAKVALIDEKIKTEKENIDAARKTIAQLDEQVNQTISRTASQDGDAGVNRSITIRRNQSKERLALSNDIAGAQSRIAKLNEEKAPIAAELRKVEAEVGPIKYIAQLIYGEEAGKDSTLLEKAVQWVTILIVAVFDPLAVVLLIAANWSLLASKRNDETVPTETVPQPSSHNEESERDQHEVQNPIPDSGSVSEQPAVPSQDPGEENILEKHPYLTKPFVHFENLKPIVAQPESPQWEIGDPPTSAEHPAFEPDSNYWGSRPPEHLLPKDPRS